MDFTKFVQECNKAHDPQSAEKGHVWILFSDGELALTKGGALLGQRTLFTEKPPCVSPEEGKEIGKEFPEKHCGLPCIYVKNPEEGERLRQILIDSFSKEEVEKQKADLQKQHTDGLAVLNWLQKEYEKVKQEQLKDWLYDKMGAQAGKCLEISSRLIDMANRK